jgi:hypothetical protein
MPAGLEPRFATARRFLRRDTTLAMAFVGLLFATLGGGCESEVVVGDWPCGSAPYPEAAGAAGEAATATLPVEVPWSTGFEDGFCGYSAVSGYCYGDPGTSRGFSVQAHSGRHAAAFRVSTTAGEQESRCVRQGVLPKEAYYGAWFYLPKATVLANWNLMHFRGWKSDQLLGLWDVSVDSTDDGQLFLYLYDFLNKTPRRRDVPIELTPGTWTHIVFYLRRAADMTGEVALFQDGREVLRYPKIVTDDSSWGQWYVGSLAVALTPPDAIVYVDDVTIDTKL